jgi:hypothetical protein
MVHPRGPSRAAPLRACSASGPTLSLVTLNTLEHAQFSRDRLGPALTPLQALGLEPEAPEIYEATD